MSNRFYSCCVIALSVLTAGRPLPLQADLPLIGLNIPQESLADGDFDLVRSNKRELKASPFWTTRTVGGTEQRIGIDQGRMTTAGGAVAEVDSRSIDRLAGYRAPNAGDVLHWRFATRAEYTCDAEVSLFLVYPDEVQTLTEKTAVPGGPVEPVEVSGTYTFTEADVKAGVPKVRVHLSASNFIRIYLEYIDIRIVDATTAGPADVEADVVSDGIRLRWSESDEPSARYTVFRSDAPRGGYSRIASEILSNEYVDRSIVPGVTHYYAIKRLRGEDESSASSVVSARFLDQTEPSPPSIVKVIEHDAEVQLEWQTADSDIHHYTLYRGDEKGASLREIATGVKGNRFTDFMPAKGVDNTYAVRAVDHSGNVSDVSPLATAKVKTVPGASFRDLIRPMPIQRSLSSNLWGADGVLPRDPDNGVEDSTWSYWGGHPVHGRDGKYHMLIARWPEAARKGHWEWPTSTVAHVISDNPVGPYKPTGETAFTWRDGRGHNPGLTLLNDGRWMLHLHSKHVLTSKSPAGPWQYEGTYTVDYNGHDKDARHNVNQYQANVVGIHREDDSLIFLSKWGATMISTNGILGPFVVVTKPVIHTNVLPPLYRNVAYEDPAFWRDEYQYHMIINGFLARRAVYFRSPDGIHWKFDPGTAYDPEVTRYEDGTRTSWYYLERPHVLQDEFGRATHFSLAVMDVTKSADYGNDRHSSKNIMMPLTVSRRLRMLNEERIGNDTKTIRVLVLSEPGFNAQTDMDPASLRFGASEEVNFGRGCRLIGSKLHAEGLVLEFDGRGNGISESNFVGKLIGRTPAGELLVGFSRLQAE